MLSTNLLPKDKLKVVRAEELRRLLIFFSMLAVVVLIIGDILLFPSFMPIYLQQVELSSALQNAENFSKENRVDETLAQEKSLRAKISSVQNYFDISGKTSQILAAVFGGSSGITFSSVNLQNSDEVSISGHADTRQSLLNYEDFLRNYGIFQDISSPISNIVKETDFDFSIEGKLKPLYAY